jgi:hypothetical protein
LNLRSGGMRSPVPMSTRIGGNILRCDACQSGQQPGERENSKIVYLA